MLDAVIRVGKEDGPAWLMKTDIVQCVEFAASKVVEQCPGLPNAINFAALSVADQF